MAFPRKSMLALVLPLALAACGGPPTPQASGNSPASPSTVRGTEHMAWDQDSVSGWIGSYRFIVYVDDQPEPLADAACQPAGSQYTCTASLPNMTHGATHRVQIATRDILGRENGRSEAIYLVRR